MCKDILVDLRLTCNMDILLGWYPRVNYFCKLVLSTTTLSNYLLFVSAIQQCRLSEDLWLLSSEDAGMWRDHALLFIVNTLYKAFISHVAQTKWLLFSIVLKLFLGRWWSFQNKVTSASGARPALPHSGRAPDNLFFFMKIVLLQRRPSRSGTVRCLKRAGSLGKT